MGEKTLYRDVNIRLTQPESQNLINTTEPGPDESYRGKYACYGERLEAFHAFDKAHLVMLYGKGYVPLADTQAMLKVFREMDEEGTVREKRAEHRARLHAGEAILTERLGREVAGKLHLGRSSGDLTAVGNIYTVLRRQLVLLNSLNKLRESLIRMAEENLDTVMPGYTHGQHAQPFTFGHYIMSMLCAFERDFQRITQFYDRFNVSPAGAAILVGSDFDLDMQKTCELLGFDRVADNTLDAIWERDWHLEAYTAILGVTMTIDRMCEDLFLWSSSECGFVEFDDSHCGTSSIMPQKKNCYSVQYLKSLCGTTLGALVENAIVYKAQTGAPVMEGQRIMDDFFYTYDEVETGIRLWTEAMDTLTVHKDRMKEFAGKYWATATDLAGAMVRELGLPWRVAHQITGATVRLAIEKGQTPDTVDTATVDEAANIVLGHGIGMTDGQIRDALDPLNSVLRHNMHGGPAPERTGEELLLHRQRLAADNAWIAAAKAKHEAAAQLLEKEIDAILSL